MAETLTRAVLDADSHVMELADFLDPFIEESQAGRLRRGGMAALEPVLASATKAAAQRRTDPEVAAAAEERLWVDKGWAAMGSFDTTERTRVLDLMGFAGQLVFATFATSMFSGRDQDRLYAGASAQNRAMVAFCEGDPRLLPVGYVPLVDPDRALALVTEAIEAGCSSIMVPSTAAGDLSPTHPKLDGFWDALAQSDTPFVLHVGGGGPLLDKAFHNNDMPVSDHLGGGENVRSKDFLGIHHSPETFLGAMVLDGMFDRFPTLRGGCIEQGAGWVVSWLHHLEYALTSFARNEPPLQRLQKTPTEYVHDHLKFTPFPGEDVGWMIEQAGADLFMFSSDYPHPEGTRDPLGKFERTLTTTSEADKHRFYFQNMADLLGSKTPVPH